MGYIHVFLKSLPHLNELHCMHLTLETTILEDHPKILKLKPTKTEIMTDICSHKLFGWQGEEGQGKQVFQEKFQSKSLQPPS